MNQANAKLWKALYAAYVGAHQDYLEVKCALARSVDRRVDTRVSDDALGSIAAGKLEKAHHAMHEFLLEHHALLAGAEGKGKDRGARRAPAAPVARWRPAADAAGSAPERPLSMV